MHVYLLESRTFGYRFLVKSIDLLEKKSRTLRKRQLLLKYIATEKSIHTDLSFEIFEEHSFSFMSLHQALNRLFPVKFLIA